MQIVNYIIEHSTEFVSNGGLLCGFLLVFIECFIPMLPLNIFVALNINAFGMVTSILTSWIATCLGSTICYFIFKYLGTKFTEKFLNRKLIKKIRKGLDTFEKITFSELVLLITLPFTPSFLINILCGLVKMTKKKFISALLIGKVFIVVFWGYIGKSFIDSLTDIKSLIFIGIALIIAYIISKIVSKKFNME